MSFRLNCQSQPAKFVGGSAANCVGFEAAMEPGASAQCTDAQHPGCRLDSPLAWLERVTEQFLKEHEAVQAWQTKAMDMSQQERCRLPCLACQAARCACSNGDHVFDALCDLVHVLAQEITDRISNQMGMTRACRSSHSSKVNVP